MKEKLDIKITKQQYKDLKALADFFGIEFEEFVQNVVIQYIEKKKNEVPF